MRKIVKKGADPKAPRQAIHTYLGSQYEATYRLEPRLLLDAAAPALLVEAVSDDGGLNPAVTNASVDSLIKAAGLGSPEKSEQDAKSEAHSEAYKDAQKQQLSTNKNSPLNIDVRNDDGKRLGLSDIQLGPEHGNVSVNAEGDLEYRPQAGFTGQDSIVFNADPLSAKQVLVEITVGTLSDDNQTTLDQLLQQSDSINEIVFVDKSVADYQSLINDIDESAAIFTIDGDSDGLSQMVTILKALEQDPDFSAASALHIVSHGSEAQLNLGSTQLTTESMQGEHADELTEIARYLNEGADILIYGCDFGAGSEGGKAAELLSDLTGADVAVSIDDTGSASLGGNWVLESHYGKLQSESISPSSWHGVLNGANYDTTVELDASGNLVITDANGGNSNDNLTIIVSGDYYTIVDPQYILGGTAASTGSGTNTVTVEIASVTGGEIQVNTKDDGAGEGDRLTIDLSGGDYSHNIIYDGGDGGPDDLQIFGGTFNSATYDFTNNTDGAISLTRTSGTTNIEYKNLEPIISTITAANVTLNYSSTGEQIDIDDVLVSGVSSGSTRVDSNAGEVITFTNPTASLTINAGGGNDEINLNSLAATYSTVQVNINGDEGSDIINIGTVANGLSNISSSGIKVDGDGHDAGSTLLTIKDSENELDSGDVLNINDQGSNDKTIYTLTATSFKSFVAGSLTTDINNYATIETLNINTTSSEATVNVNSTANSVNTNIVTQDDKDIVTVTNTGENSNLTVELGGNPTSSFVDNRLVITGTGNGSFIEADGGGNNDYFDVQNIGENSRVKLNAAAGADVFNLRSSVASSFLEVYGGSGSDLFVLGMNQSLDTLLGTLCIDGGDHDNSPQPAFTIKGDSNPLSVGDSLEIDDQNTESDESYTLGQDLSSGNLTFTRSGLNTITYGGIETVNLRTTKGVATVQINILGDSTRNIVTTQDAADTVTVSDTGRDSNLEINTQAGNDTITINDTGVNGTETDTLGSFTIVNAGDDDDTVTLENSGDDSRVELNGENGVDTINVRNVGANSVTDVSGGAQRDTINIGSTSYSLDGIKSNICVSGDEHDNTSFTGLGIKGVANSVPSGDTLTIRDRGISQDSTYELTSTTFNRMNANINTGTINYEKIETLIIDTTRGQATVNIISTADSTYAEINTRVDNDTINMFSSGVDSNVVVNSFGGDNTVNVDGTGGDGSDSNSWGSFVSISTFGTGSDNFTLTDSGDGSRLRFRGGDGVDTFDILASGTASVTEIRAGSGSDTINLGSTSNSLSGILGEVCVEGDSHDSGDSSLSIKGETNTLESGDILNINDQGISEASTYRLTATTFMRTNTTATTGTVTYKTIETLNINTTSGAATINVDDTAAAVNTNITSRNAADSVTVTTTGVDSNLRIETDKGADTVTIHDAGGDGDDSNSLGSFVVVASGFGGDILTLADSGVQSRVRFESGRASDTINIRATGNASVTQVIAWIANDTINIGSLTHSLSGILGDVCVEGNQGGTGDTDLIIKGDTNTLLNSDVLNINDQGDSGSYTYTLTHNSFSRTSIGTVTYNTIETLNLNTATGAADVDVIDTADRVNTTITTQDGNDDIDISDTGRDSNVVINTAGNSDSIDITTTGIDGNDANDFGSFTQINAGFGADVFNLYNSGAKSRVELNGEAGGDTINVRGVAAESVTNVNGGVNGDIINIGSDSNSLDGILSDVCVNGDAHDDDTGMSPLTIKTDTNSLVSGDVLNINDQGNPANFTYTLNSTTLERSSLTGKVIYNTIETLNLNTSIGAATVNISDTLAATTTEITTQDNADTLTVTTTGDDSNTEINTGEGNDSVTILDTGVDGIDGNSHGSFTQVRTGRGTDTIVVADSGEQSRVSIQADRDADTVNIQVTGHLSVTEVRGGLGRDTVNIGSSSHSLSAVLGEVCIEGDGNFFSAENLTIKGVTNTLDNGDVLNINDHGDSGSYIYQLNAGNLSRTATATVTYGTIELLNVNTSLGSATVNVLTTTAGINTKINTQDNNDSVMVTNSGEDSNLFIDTANGNDSVTIENTGGDGSDSNSDGSFTEVKTQRGTDSLTLQNSGERSRVSLDAGRDADDINIQATGTMSVTEIKAGFGRDTVNLGSSTQSLAGILGDVCIEGDLNFSSPESLTIKGDTNTLDRGDVLNIYDQGDIGSYTYTLDASNFTRTGIGTVTYGTLELINLNTSIGSADVDVSDTAASVNTHITTQDANDDIDVNDSGDESNLKINTAGGDDQVDIQFTGSSAGSSVFGSFTQVNAGEGADTLTLINSGALSRVELNGQGGIDVINVQMSGFMSVTNIIGGDNSDTINLGYLVNTLNGLLGDVCIDGGTHDTLTTSLTIKGVRNTLQSGDILNINDQASTTDHHYDVLSSSDGPAVERYSDLGSSSIVNRIVYNAVETLNLNTTQGASEVNVFTTPDASTTTITTQDEKDDVSVFNTGVGSNLTVNLGANPSPIFIDNSLTISNSGEGSFIVGNGGDNADYFTVRLKGDNSRLQVNGGAGADIYNLRESSASSVIEANGGDGSDQFYLFDSLILDSLLGEVCIEGDAHDTGNLKSLSIKSELNSLEEGDILNFQDLNSSDDKAYTFSRDLSTNKMMFVTALNTVTFNGIEAVDLFATSGISTVKILSTADASRTRIVTQNQADSVEVSGSGADSNIEITTAGGADTISITGTGSDGSDDDSLGSFTKINAGNDNDTLNLNGNGQSSRVELDGGAGMDTINVQATASNSLTAVWGGINTDIINLGSSSHSLGGILGDVCIDGGAHDAGTIDLQFKGDTNTLDTGDIFNINDQGDAGSFTYQLSHLNFTRTGIGTIDYGAIETLNLNASQATAVIDVTLTANGVNTNITTQEQADNITVHFTGQDSNLKINSAGGDDQVLIRDTDGDSRDSNDFGSFTQVNAGWGADVISLGNSAASSRVEVNGEQGSDTINVRRVGVESVTNVNGGDNSDTINIGSDSDSLNGLLSDVCVNGDGHDTESSDLSIKNDTNSLVRGDILNINDQGSIVSFTYTLNSTTIERSSLSGKVIYNTIETLNLNTTMAAAWVNITDTLPATTTQLTTQDNADRVTVTTTGDDSNLVINTAGGADTIDIVSTGGNGGSGSAFGSFTQVNAGLQADKLTLQANGQNSRVELNGEEGQDIIDVKTTAAGSVTNINGGDNSDTVNLGSDNSLGGLLGGVCVEGDAHDSGNTLLNIKNDSNALDSGDVLNLFDFGDSGSYSYVLDSVLTGPGTYSNTFMRTGTAIITYNTIETVNLNTSQGGADVDVKNTAPRVNTNIQTQDASDDIDIDNTGFLSSVDINTGGGADDITLETTGDGSFTRINAGESDDSLLLKNSGAYARVELNGENDVDTFKVYSTGQYSVTNISGGDNSDTVIIGSLANSLSGLLGDICIDGGEHDLGVGIWSRLSIKGEENSLDSGDELYINDFGDTAGYNYSLTDMRFTRSNIGDVDYDEIESLFITSTSGVARVVVESTADGISTDITTREADDEIIVNSTGQDSNLVIAPYIGNDTVTIQNTGGDGDGDSLGSFTFIQAFSGDDTLNLNNSGMASRIEFMGLDGADTVNVRGTGAMSVTNLIGGTNSDTFNLGVLYNSLSEILGDVCISGNSHDSGDTNFLTIKTDSNTLDSGDALNFFDQNNFGAYRYELDVDTLQRFSNGSSIGKVTFYGIESLDLNTGQGGAEINVSSTSNSSHTKITSQDAADKVEVASTGNNANLVINTAGGDDTVLINNTMTSFVQVNAGSGHDILKLKNNGLNSRVEFNGEAGRDLLDVYAAALGSVVNLQGGLNNDTINLGSLANSLGTFFGIVCIDGQEHDASETQTLTIKYDSNVRPLGDVLNIKDQTGNFGDYLLTSMMLTHSASSYKINYERIETLNLNTRQANTMLTIESTAAGTHTNVNMQAGDDKLIVQNTGVDSNLVINSDGGNDEITVLNTGGDGADLSSLGSFTQVNAGDDDDTVLINNAGAMSLIEVNGEGGNDNIQIDESLSQNVCLSLSAEKITLGDDGDVGSVETGEVSFEQGSRIFLELGGITPGDANDNHEQIAASGKVKIADDVELNLASVNGFTPSGGDSFVLIDNDGADPIDGVFKGLAEGAIIPDFLGTGLDATITYQGGDGNDVEIGIIDSRVSVSDATIAEGDTGITALEFTVTRIGALNKALTLNYRVSGSGEFPSNGIDFNGGVLPIGQITFASGQSSAILTVNVAGDILLENDNTFTLGLRNSVANDPTVVIENASAIGTIVNDDAADDLFETVLANLYMTFMYLIQPEADDSVENYNIDITLDDFSNIFMLATFVNWGDVIDISSLSTDLNPDATTANNFNASFTDIYGTTPPHVGIPGLSYTLSPDGALNSMSIEGVGQWSVTDKGVQFQAAPGASGSHQIILYTTMPDGQTKASVTINVNIPASNGAELNLFKLQQQAAQQELLTTLQGLNHQSINDAFIDEADYQKMGFSQQLKSVAKNYFHEV